MDTLDIFETYFEKYQCSKIETYSDFHTMRLTATSGGGVSIYVKN